MNKKKIAILVGGLPRFSKITSDLFNSISSQFETCEIDWFFYLWNYSIPQLHVHESWLNLNYEKTYDSLSKRLTHNNRLTGLEIGTYENSPISFIPMFLSLYRANLMKQKVEIENSFYYDLVIRLRPDMNIIGNIPLDIEEKSILVPHIDYQGTYRTTINDWFAAGSSDNINKYVDIVNHVQKYQGLLQWPEMVLSTYLGQIDLKPYTSTDVKFIFRPYPDSNLPWTD